MKQFDVCHNLSNDSADRIPFLLVLQSDLLDELSTCVVAPLVRKKKFEPADRLYPCFEIEGQKLVLSVPELAGVPVGVIGKPLLSLSEKRDDIIRALDVLFLGW